MTPLSLYCSRPPPPPPLSPTPPPIPHMHTCLVLKRFTRMAREASPLYCGSSDGAVVRALASHQCGPGSIPRLGVKCGLSLLLVRGPSLLQGFFSGFSGFPPSAKSKQWSKSHSVDSTQFPFIYLFYKTICNCSAQESFTYRDSTVGLNNHSYQMSTFLNMFFFLLFFFFK